MDAFLAIYIWSAIVLYMALGLSLIVKFITFRTVHVPSNSTGLKFGEFAEFTCDADHCSLIQLSTSGNCKLKCTTTDECECYHSSPLLPGACFLYRNCDGNMVAAPNENKHLKFYFGMRDRITGPLT